MVGVKLFHPNHLGLVTITATLLVVAVVKGEHGVLFDTEHETDVFLKCDESSSKSFTIDTDEKEAPQKKIFKLTSESEGCFKSRKPIPLSSASKFVIKFFSDNSQDESGKLFLRLAPLEGACEENECVWEISKDPMFKNAEWVTAEHKFPLKSAKKYYVQLLAEKRKGKFLLDSLRINDDGSNSIKEVDEVLGGINVPDRFVSGNDTPKNGCDGFKELSKNLLLTSASVLTLNNLLN